MIINRVKKRFGKRLDENKKAHTEFVVLFCSFFYFVKKTFSCLP